MLTNIPSFNATCATGSTRRNAGVTSVLSAEAAEGMLTSIRRSFATGATDHTWQSVGAMTVLSAVETEEKSENR